MPSVVRLHLNGVEYSRRVCEVVAEAFLPNPQGLENVVHIDGDIHNDVASNLAWSEARDYTPMADWNGLSAKEHRLYNIWKCMNLRCEDGSRDYYDRYGGRGISVCDEWRDFAKFSAWSYANGYDDGLTIDRIDNNGDYRPENCRWATPQQQALNTSKNVRIRIGDKEQTAVEWADETGISQYTIYYWVREFGEEYAAERITEATRTNHSRRIHEKTCLRCGKPFTTDQGHAKYCVACRPIARIEGCRNWRARKKAESCGAHFGRD